MWAWVIHEGRLVGMVIASSTLVLCSFVENVGVPGTFRIAASLCRLCTNSGCTDFGMQALFNDADLSVFSSQPPCQCYYPPILQVRKQSQYKWSIQCHTATGQDSGFVDPKAYSIWILQFGFSFNKGIQTTDTKLDKEVNVYLEWENKPRQITNFKKLTNHKHHKI